MKKLEFFKPGKIEFNRIMVEKNYLFFVQTMVGVEKSHGKMTVPVSNKIYSIFLKESRSFKRELYKQVLRFPNWINAKQPRGSWLYLESWTRLKCEIIMGSFMRHKSSVKMFRSNKLHAREGQKRKMSHPSPRRDSSVCV